MFRRSTTTYLSSSSFFLKSSSFLLQRHIKDYLGEDKHQQSSWEYAEVDEEGRTDLDKKYEQSAEKVRQQFAQPIQYPEGISEKNGKECDFLIGFSQYRYTMRDTYRKTLALALTEIEGGAELLKELNEFASSSSLIKTPESSSDELKKSPQAAFSPMNIDLTVAWKGRFALQKFRGCHKVVGVSLVVPNNETSNDTNID